MPINHNTVTAYGKKLHDKEGIQKYTVCSGLEDSVGISGMFSQSTQTYRQTWILCSSGLGAYH